MGTRRNLYSSGALCSQATRSRPLFSNSGSRRHSRAWWRAFCQLVLSCVATSSSICHLFRPKAFFGWFYRPCFQSWRHRLMDPPSHPAKTDYPSLTASNNIYRKACYISHIPKVCRGIARKWHTGSLRPSCAATHSEFHPSQCRVTVRAQVPSFSQRSYQLL